MSVEPSPGLDSALICLLKAWESVGYHSMGAAVILAASRHTVNGHEWLAATLGSDEFHRQSWLCGVLWLGAALDDGQT